MEGQIPLTVLFFFFFKFFLNLRDCQPFSRKKFEKTNGQRLLKTAVPAIKHLFQKKEEERTVLNKFKCDF